MIQSKRISYAVVMGFVLYLLGLFVMNGVVHAKPEDLVIYVSEGCPHCAKVEEFIEENNLEDNFEIKNVTVDGGVAEEYTNFVQDNDLPLEEQGTPTLVYKDGDDLRWVVGDTPIISFIEENYDVDNSTEDTSEDEKISTEDIVILVVGGIIVSSVLGYGIFKSVNDRRKG
ncbi:hypothetical protein JW710_02685 [Candidatus Dojkabacteria bacterium]|nr:hypothetical protein [Candidatus Dojkabacteria bacterium]